MRDRRMKRRCRGRELHKARLPTATVAAAATTAADSVGTGAEAATATTASTEATAATTAAAATVAAHLLELRGNVRLGLAENADKLPSLLAVVRGEVSVRSSLGTGTTSTADTVDVVLAVVGEVVVDDVTGRQSEFETYATE